MLAGGRVHDSWAKTYQHSLPQGGSYGAERSIDQAPNGYVSVEIGGLQRKFAWGVPWGVPFNPLQKGKRQKKPTHTHTQFSPANNGSNPFFRLQPVFPLDPLKPQQPIFRLASALATSNSFFASSPRAEWLTGARPPATRTRRSLRRRCRW